MATKPKVERGLIVQATQRVNKNESVRVSGLNITANERGIVMQFDVGHGRAFSVFVQLTAEEVSAWIPEMLKQRSLDSVKKVSQRVKLAEQRMRSLAASEATALGFVLPFLPGEQGPS